MGALCRKGDLSKYPSKLGRLEIDSKIILLLAFKNLED
jgi:hypothetical protein